MLWKNDTISDLIRPEDIFQCQMCGDCCRGYGGTYVTEPDILAIAAYLNLEPGVIQGKYCVFSGKKPLLAQKHDGYCIFWDGLCTIHPVKPRMCRSWPFLESVLIDIGNWEIMSSLCPGIRTDFSPEVIKKCVQRKIAENNNYDRHI